MSECASGNCPITQSPDYRVIKPMPYPTDADLNDKWFDYIWEAIKGMKISCPEYYEGWQIATGQHVKIILDQIKVVK